MNPKIQKTRDEIVKTKERIIKNQARLRELERQLTELENAEILAAVRAVDVPPEELKGLIQKIQEGIA